MSTAVIDVTDLKTYFHTEEGVVRVKISLQTRDPELPRTLHAQATAALQAVPGVTRVELDFDLKDPPTTQGPAGPLMKQSIDGVKRIVAVASALVPGLADWVSAKFARTPK